MTERIARKGGDIHTSRSWPGDLPGGGLTNGTKVIADGNKAPGTEHATRLLLPDMGPTRRIFFRLMRRG